MKNLNELQAYIGRWADDKGFRDSRKDLPETFRRLAVLALIGEEVGEAVTAARKTGTEEDNYQEELADIVIRVLDEASYCKFSLWDAIQEKMAVNEKRPRMHGKQA